MGSHSFGCAPNHTLVVQLYASVAACTDQITSCLLFDRKSSNLHDLVSKVGQGAVRHERRS